MPDVHHIQDKYANNRAIWCDLLEVPPNFCQLVATKQDCCKVYDVDCQCDAAKEATKEKARTCVSVT